MTRTYFDKELEVLHTDLIRMGSMIEQAIKNSIKSLETRDYALAKEIVDNDKNVDEMEKEIETRCLRLLWHQQPVAKDLRAISTAIKMITDMERIGDQAADIADISLHRKIKDIQTLAPSILIMSKTAIEMVSDSIQSFIHSDLILAKLTIEKDDIVDDYFEQVKQDLIALVKRDQSQADCVIDALMISKYLERIGDHAVNICEWVEFYQTGVRKESKLL